MDLPKGNEAIDVAKRLTQITDLGAAKAELMFLWLEYFDTRTQMMWYKDQYHKLLSSQEQNEHDTH